MEDPAKRFWSRVAKGPGSGCWEWTGWRNPNGYGRLAANGCAGALAHRVAWEITAGPVPDGMLVLHHCDNPSCVRAETDPASSHLFLGTRADNSRDMDAKGRRRTYVLSGKRDDIVARHAGGESMVDIAHSLGVHYMSIWRVIRRGAPLAPKKPARQRKGRPRGEGHWKAKLTEADVREIRAARATGVPIAALVSRFGVDKALVSRIANRRLWAHVA